MYCTIAPSNVHISSFLHYERFVKPTGIHYILGACNFYRRWHCPTKFYWVVQSVISSCSGSLFSPPTRGNSASLIQKANLPLKLLLGFAKNATKIDHGNLNFPGSTSPRCKPVHSNAISTSLGSIQPRCNCAKTIRSHIHLCSQVLIYTSE